MWQAVFGGALGLMLRQLAEVIVEAVGGLAVEAGPEAGSQIAAQPARAMA
jgi:hypothetical protein